MENIVWPAHLYSFLSHITSKVNDLSLGKKVLDCGAGGKQPPLALFKQHSFETYGIEISPEQIEKAQEFAKDQGVELDIREADMRNIPFEDKSFDFVYEYFSMCHMIKADIARTIGEITRVLKKGGYGFLGFISWNTWPLIGREQKKGSGEFWAEEDGVQVIHSVFTEEEAERYLAGLVIVQKEVWRFSQPERLAKLTWEEWIRDWDTEDYPEEEKRTRYDNRTRLANYSHIFYIARRPKSQ